MTSTPRASEGRVVHGFARLLAGARVLAGVGALVLPLWAYAQESPQSADAFGSLVDAGVREASAAGREWHEGPSLPWPRTSAIRDRPPILRSEAARAFLVEEIRKRARSVPAPSALELSTTFSTAVFRQGVALEYMASGPSAGEVEAVAGLIDGGRIWEPWRAALVLGASGDPSHLGALARVLEADDRGWAGGQTALAIGMLGNADGTPLLEEFLRERYGTREFNLGVEALILLGKQGDEQRKAVENVCTSLTTRHPSRLRTVDGVTSQEDHPGRVRTLQNIAFHVLLKVGALKDEEAGLAAFERLRARGLSPGEEEAALRAVASGDLGLPTGEAERFVGAAQESEDPLVRQRAFVASHALRLPSSRVENLVAALEDPDPDVRETVYGLLRPLSNNSFGYNAHVDPAGQRQAMQKWQEWARRYRPGG